MQSNVTLLALLGAATCVLTAPSAKAQTLPGDQKMYQGAGIFTSARIYMGPVVGYVDSSISSAFTFTYTYYNFMGSDTILPGSVRISAPTLFAGDVAFTGRVGMTMPSAASYDITLENPSTIDYLDLKLDVAAPFPAGGGDVSVLPTSTISLAGRRSQYAGTITAFSIGTSAAAVPEASTWMLMMIGVGIVGGMLRRRTKENVRVTFA